METKKKVLIVEDEEEMREALAHKFELSGFQADVAKDGVEGLAKALDIHPDIIILDILMPRMDGVSVLRKLKDDSWGKKVPVVILTNISDARQLDEAISLGISAYMVKSDWGLKEVIAKAEEVLALNYTL